MCNLYNVTTNQEAIRRMFRIDLDNIGNLQPSLDVYPDRMAPIIRNTPAGRELAMVRWGLPSSSKALFDATVSRPFFFRTGRCRIWSEATGVGAKKKPRQFPAEAFNQIIRSD